MLTRLRLTNYRGFEDHEVPLRATSILVGRNNAGKSTAVEALRFVSIVTERLSGLGFTEPYHELGIRHVGVKPSLRQAEVNFRSICHNYTDPPAIAEATFSSGATLTVYLFMHRGRHNEPQEAMHAVIRNAQGRIVSTRAEAMKCGLDKVSILPQIGPVLQEEKPLAPGYVRGAMSSPLAPRHFRNQLKLLYDEYFAQFADLAEANWPRLRVDGLEGSDFPSEEPLSLLVRDGKFVGELAWMGHGLQMYLQTIWFLARTPPEATVILDEPDVYMHADLQRRLIRLLRGRYRQIVLATHSIEIMEEVEPGEIVIIDKESSRSHFADSVASAQSAVELLGSVQNLHLVRLLHSKRFLHVEGKDLAILKRLHDRLFPKTHVPLDTIPNVPLEGRSRWPWAFGSAATLKNVTGDAVVLYCILDSDYHSDEELQKQYHDAQQVGIQLHIWRRKEIENYLVVPRSIRSVLWQETPWDAAIPSEEEIVARIDEITLGMEDDVFDSIASETCRQSRSVDTKTANRKAREAIAELKRQGRPLVELVSGKALISALSRWTQEKWGVSLSPRRIAKAMRSEDIPDEVVQVLESIENCAVLPFSGWRERGW